MHAQWFKYIQILVPIFPKAGEYLDSLRQGSVKHLIMPFLDSVSLHIYIQFLSNASKVCTLQFTYTLLALCHLGYFNRILRASLYALSCSSSLYYGYTIDVLCKVEGSLDIISAPRKFACQHICL